jgi:micrococcal nuclease
MRRVRIGAALVAAAALATVAASGHPPTARPAASTAGERGIVTRVLDGDTLDVKLDGGARRVRLIGVDTPETRENTKLARDVRRTGRSREALLELGRTAAAFTRDAVLGREVRLELDVERRDRYGRVLAYVWLSDGRLLNAELLREGHAMLMTVPPNVRHVDLFRRLQTEAREARRGMWRRSPSLSSTRRGGRARDCAAQVLARHPPHPCTPTRAGSG